MHSGYVPLRIFSSFTMLDGAIDPKAIAAQAKANAFPAAGLTDRNGLYAAMAFSDAAKKAGVQPIIGTMLGVARPDMPDSVTPVVDWIALYAQDMTGYDNLCALVSAAHLERPIELAAHVGFDTLGKFSTGLIALTAGGEGASPACSPRAARPGKGLLRPASGDVRRPALYRARPTRRSHGDRRRAGSDRSGL